MRAVILMMACIAPLLMQAESRGRTVIDLNGTWQFEQSATAFPPARFTRTIPVPGLIHLATPRIEQYDKFFARPAGHPQLQEQHNLMEMDYAPMYSWYKRRLRVSKDLEGMELVLTIRKSQYVTAVYINGMQAGYSMECYTPIELPISRFIRFGEENEILIRVGDRAWLPSEAAGGTDKEKAHYLPGIWDDVYLSATGKIRVDKALFLPSLSKGTVTLKTRLRSLFPAQIFYGDAMEDSCRLVCIIRDKSGRIVSQAEADAQARRDALSYVETRLAVPEAHPWSPEDPYLYEGELRLYLGGQLSDSIRLRFGMRDFGRNGRNFTLNSSRYYLRGSNITLQRFFEDPDCRDLAWNREWVRKLMIDLPKSVGWNAMRICVGIAPDFWYDLCDEYGILLQNEWLYWQNHGWNEQIRREYSEWVWSDGNHPSIVIWDAINENWDNYIGNTLIPELKLLDPTRIWDAGYMTGDRMANDEMDEPHPYRSVTLMPPAEAPEYFRRNPYPLGDLDYWTGWTQIASAGVPQLVNEYGWMWLWRNGSPSKLTVNNYAHYLGENSTAASRRALQAYWIQLETEWLRSERSIAGVLAFCHLTNNYGFTGDWFMGDIKDLEPSPAFRWFRHSFSPEAVFINITDGRYTSVPPMEAGADLSFNLVGVNDRSAVSEGRVNVRLRNDRGEIVAERSLPVRIPPYGKQLLPISLKLPPTPGGYLLTAEYTSPTIERAVMSRRYLKVGNPAGGAYAFFEPND
ncbi:MAG: glycoside hydrolase family 2 [Tannerellaceae bacterium]|jgi:hypothetical protein|nr:glycoside hydrolase family 2 [Tannerellaceae bacterium]